MDPRDSDVKDDWLREDSWNYNIGSDKTRWVYTYKGNTINNNGNTPQTVDKYNTTLVVSVDLNLLFVLET